MYSDKLHGDSWRNKHHLICSAFLFYRTRLHAVCVLQIRVTKCLMQWNNVHGTNTKRGLGIYGTLLLYCIISRNIQTFISGTEQTHETKTVRS